MSSPAVRFERFVDGLGSWLAVRFRRVVGKGADAIELRLAKKSRADRNLCPFSPGNHDKGAGAA